MEKQKKDNATDSDDSDMGFYMPSIIQKTGDTPPRAKKPEKITKKVSKKKKKTTSSKKPPRQASPTLGKPQINVAALRNSTDNIQRKSQTMSEEAKNAMQISNSGAQPFMILPPGGGSTLTSGGIPIRSGATPMAQSQQRMLEMMGPKEILQHEIEQERDKITTREKRQRDALETQRKMH